MKLQKEPCFYALYSMPTVQLAVLQVNLCDRRNETVKVALLFKVEPQATTLLQLFNHNISL